MDPNNKRSDGSQLEEAEDVTESSNEKKCCTDCHTTRTPLWRGGPAGPKSLCNACGIKYHKKRRRQQMNNNKSFDKNVTKTSKNVKLKMKLMVVNQNKKPQTHNHHDIQQQRSQRKRSLYERGKPWWNKLREEEQAAILLMAISCGGSMYS